VAGWRGHEWVGLCQAVSSSSLLSMWGCLVCWELYTVEREVERKREFWMACTNGYRRLSFVVVERNWVGCMNGGRRSSSLHGKLEWGQCVYIAYGGKFGGYVLSCVLSWCVFCCAHWFII